MIRNAPGVVIQKHQEYRQAAEPIQGGHAVAKVEMRGHRRYSSRRHWGLNCGVRHNIVSKKVWHLRGFWDQI